MQLAVRMRTAHDRGGPMHIPDGFINGGTSLAAGGIAVGGTAVCLNQASKTLDDRQIPMVGLSAAFIFAAQMLNFPVASGTSGHLLGGVLAAVLVGPWAGAICVTVVLFVQALLFADGGLSALGLNVVNMALVGTFVGYGIFLAVRRLLPAKRSSVVVASGIAAGLAPVLAAVFFTLEYAIGGNGAASVGDRRGSHDRRPPPDRHRRGRDHRNDGLGRARQPPRPRVRGSGHPPDHRPALLSPSMRSGPDVPHVSTRTFVLAGIARRARPGVPRLAVRELEPGRPGEGRGRTRASTPRSPTTRWPTAPLPTTPSTASRTPA